jgi:hypothetical protein
MKPSLLNPLWGTFNRISISPDLLSFVNGITHNP